MVIPGDRSSRDDDRDDRDDRHYGRDDVQDLANQMGRDLYVGADGFVRSDARDTISADRSSHGDMSQGSSGGCGQHEDNLPRD